ncbi:MAG TPA: ATP-binding protein [Chryseolinea sp.]|nr:ATP-binding protein [Chryseolinea sp.]
MKISTLILTGFFVILVLFTITTYINYKQSDKINENSDLFATSSTILRHSNRIQRNVSNMVSGLRGYLLTQESSFIESYDSAVNENVLLLEQLSNTSLLDRQKTLLAEIAAHHEQWVSEFAEPLVNAKMRADLSDSSAASFARLYRRKLADNSEKNFQQLLQRNFREFSNLEYNYRDRQKELLTASVEQTRSASFYLTALSIIMGMAIAVFLAQHISSGIVKLTFMADAIAGGNYHTRVNIDGNDEVSRLTRSLNNMARILAENISLLRRKNEELNQFAHIVSHDLKGPLRGIDNVVSWIEEDHRLDLPPKVREYISLIKGRLSRAENLLNGILSYSRVGREVQALEMVNVNELLREVQDYLPDKPSTQLIIQPGMPVLHTERLPLLQIFSNLISNAVKYNDDPQPRVKVYYDDVGEFYRFFVEDNGPGIAKSYHEKIFMIFQTLQERDLFESTGVGLAIVKKILTERKLDIELISSPGSGSTFIFSWPKSKAL